MKTQPRSFTLFCGGELLILMGSILAGIRAGMRIELSNVARSPFPEAGWDVPIAYLDYRRFFLVSGLCLMVLTIFWFPLCLRLSRRAPARTAGAARWWLPWAAGLAGIIAWGMVCGTYLPLWEYAVLLVEGSRILPSDFHLPSAVLGFAWTAAGMALTGFGAKRIQYSEKSKKTV